MFPALSHKFLRQILLFVGGIYIFNFFIFGSRTSTILTRTQWSPSSHMDEQEWNMTLATIPPISATDKDLFKNHAKIFRGYLRLLDLASRGHLNIFTSQSLSNLERIRQLKEIEERALSFAKPQKDNTLLIDKFWSLPERKSAKNVIARRQRGIVLSAGKKQFQFTLGLVGALRMAFNSTLPIEIWNNGVDDMTDEQMKAITSLGGDTTFHDLNEYSHLWHGSKSGIHRSGYTTKVFALLASNFDEPLLMDVDAVFLQNPEVLWKDPGYIETGTLFYHDRLYGAPKSLLQIVKVTLDGSPPTAALNNSRWWQEVDPKTNNWSNQMDSGVVLVDKRRLNVLTAVLYTAWMNSEDVYDYLQEYTYGEKESYWLACEFLGIPYHFDPSYGSAIGTWNEMKKVCVTEAIFHVDSRNKPLWYNGIGFRDSKSVDREASWFEPNSYTLQDRNGTWNQMTSWMFPMGHSGPRMTFDGEYKEVLAKQVNVAKVLENKFKTIL